MIIKKPIVILLLTLVSANLCSAQNGRDAEAFLDKVIDRLQHATGVTASFTLRSDDRNALYMEGELKMKGKKFYLHTKDMTTWYDGKTMWSYARSINEVNITEPSVQELMSINPYYSLSHYKKAFGVSELKAARSGERQICLIPLDRNTSLSRIVITIATATLSPVSFEVTDLNRNTTHISITDYDTKTSLPEQTFIFTPDQYPQAEVIDLR